LGHPGLALVEGPEETQVHPHRVSAVVLDHLVGVDHVAFALRHLFVALAELVAVVLVVELAAPLLDLGPRHDAPGGIVVAEGGDHPLVPQLREGFVVPDVAGVFERLLPHAGVEQVPHRVLRAAHVEIDGHPVVGLLSIAEGPIVLGIAVAEEIPRRTCRTRHGVGLALQLLAGDRIVDLDPRTDHRQG
jgi:hypothetical protein